LHALDAAVLRGGIEGPTDLFQAEMARQPWRRTIAPCAAQRFGPERVAEKISQVRWHCLVARRPQDDAGLPEAGDGARQIFFRDQRGLRERGSRGTAGV